MKKNPISLALRITAIIVVVAIVAAIVIAIWAGSTPSPLVSSLVDKLAGVFTMGIIAIIAMLPRANDHQDK